MSEDKAAQSVFDRLCQAIQHGNLIQLKEWVCQMEDKEKLKERDEDGNTLLLIAVKYGHLQLVKWLLSSDISSLDERNTKGDCCLIMATFKNHKELIFYFLDAGLLFTTTTNKNSSLFIMACSSQASNLEMCQWLLAKGNGLFTVNDENEFGRTALMYALTKSDTAVSKWLIDQGASVHRESKENENLLAFAVWHASTVDNLKLVLQYIPDKINSYCTEHCTPLLFAGRQAKGNSLEIVKFLLANGSKIAEVEKGDASNILIQVAASGKEDTMKWLFDNYSVEDLHVPNSKGCTALHDTRGIECTKILVSKGLDVNRRANDGSTPLLRSLKDKEYGVAEYLISQGAKDYIGNEQQEYPIEHVIASGKVDLFVSFMERGTCSQSLSISHIAFKIVFYDKLEMLQYLSQSHSLVELTQGENDDCLLHGACFYGHKVMVEWLLENGFHWDDKNTLQFTPFHFCIRGGFKELAQFFLDKGASVNERYKNYVNPLSTAVCSGKDEIYEWLAENGAEQSEICSLTAAVFTNKPEMVRFLAKRGESVNNQESACLGPIYNAVSCGNLEIVKILVEFNASLSIVPEDEPSYLVSALNSGNTELVEWIIHNAPGASLSMRDENENSCLLIAAMNGNIPLINWLLLNGASLEERNAAGQTLFTIPSEDPDFHENLAALFDSKKIKSARK